MRDSTGHVVVLFGAPAVGKDTVSKVLASRDSQYVHFVKHKRGTGSKHGYSVVSDRELQELRDAGRLLSEVERYGSIYAIDRERLDGLLAKGHIVLVHSAEPAEAIRLKAMGARLVILACSRDTAASRLRHRDPDTVVERLEVWDQVESYLRDLAPTADMRINTDELSPNEVANAIEKLG